jgi:predicted Zn finger-like uncharacterized protein
MVVGCVNCSTKFVVPDDKVPESGIKVRCSKCQHTFYIKKEKPKRGGPSSVVMIAPDLIDEIQRVKEEGPAAGVQIADDLEAPSAPAVAASAPVEAPAPIEEAKPVDVQRRVGTQIMQRTEEPNATQKLSANIIPKGPRAVSPANMPKEEDVLELSEVYLPADWTKRAMVAFLLLLVIGIGVGVAAIIRNDFKVPASRDFFYVLLNGPRKQAPLFTFEDNGKLSFETSTPTIEKLITSAGATIVAVQGEVKNGKGNHNKFYVRATLQNAAGEKLESERPCGTRLDSAWLLPVKSQADLDALYTEDGRDGANKAEPYSSVNCSVVFFAAPAWAEHPTGTTFVVTRADGAVVAP